MAETKTYGAVDVPEGKDDFDERNTYYLNQSKFNWNRFFRAAVPVVIALVIMGGFAYGMSHGFNHLYGPPKGKDDDNLIKEDESWIPAENPEGSSAACSENEKCVKLDLLGDCCPTKKGVVLECCK
ncbi:hypothetical protein ACHAWF_012985 [Thalassiosira exigua]